MADFPLRDARVASVWQHGDETVIALDAERGTYRFSIASEAVMGSAAIRSLQDQTVAVAIGDDGVIRFSPADGTEVRVGTLPAVEAWQIDGPSEYLAIAVPGGGWDYFDETSIARPIGDSTFEADGVPVWPPTSEPP